jgi:hypothetical protein
MPLDGTYRTAYLLCFKETLKRHLYGFVSHGGKQCDSGTVCCL